MQNHSVNLHHDEELQKALRQMQLQQQQGASEAGLDSYSGGVSHTGEDELEEGLAGQGESKKCVLDL
jgi:hypothetical protein